MKTFSFFVRNVVIAKGASLDLIHNIIDGNDPKQTPFVRYNEKSYVSQSKEMQKVVHFETYGGCESKAYFTALKTFMVMGFNADLTFNVDSNFNVTVVTA